MNSAVKEYAGIVKGFFNIALKHNIPLLSLKNTLSKIKKHKDSTNVDMQLVNDNNNHKDYKIII